MHPTSNAVAKTRIVIPEIVINFESVEASLAATAEASVFSSYAVAASDAPTAETYSGTDLGDAEQRILPPIGPCPAFANDAIYTRLLKAEGIGQEHFLGIWIAGNRRPAIGIGNDPDHGLVSDEIADV